MDLCINIGGKKCISNQAEYVLKIVPGPPRTRIETGGKYDDIKLEINDVCGNVFGRTEKSLRKVRFSVAFWVETPDS